MIFFDYFRDTNGRIQRWIQPFGDPVSVLTREDLSSKRLTALLVCCGLPAGARDHEAVKRFLRCGVIPADWDEDRVDIIFARSW